MTPWVIGALVGLWLLCVGALVYGFILEAREKKEHPERFVKRWDGKLVRRGHEFDNLW